MKIEELSRKQIRYILFRIKDAVTHEQIIQRQKPKPPLRRVHDRQEQDVKNDDGIVTIPKIKKPFAKGEAKELLAGWGFEISAAAADKLVDEIKQHFEAEEHFSGWKFFAEPNGVFAAWDIGIEDVDERTKQARPEKKWLFDKPALKANLRGLQRDGKSALEIETGLEAVKFETEVL